MRLLQCSARRSEVEAMKAVKISKAKAGWRKKNPKEGRESEVPKRPRESPKEGRGNEVPKRPKEKSQRGLAKVAGACAEEAKRVNPKEGPRKSPGPVPKRPRDKYQGLIPPEHQQQVDA